MGEPIPIAKKKAYAKNRAKGLPREMSAVMAGLDVKDGHAARDIERTLDVQVAFKKEIAQLRKQSGTTKEDVLQYILDACEMARILQEPATMIMAARELSKMLGYNAPEVKKVEHQIGSETLKALENLSDHELLKLSRGRTIDGEAVHIQ